MSDTHSTSVSTDIGDGKPDENRWTATHAKTLRADVLGRFGCSVRNCV